MRDFSADFAGLRRRLDDARRYLRIEANGPRLAELEKAAGDPALWDDPDAARKVTTELARLRDDGERIERLEARLSDTQTLDELAREEGDDTQEAEIAAGVADLDADLVALDLEALFTGEHDERDAICEIHSGAGGTDAADWADMMLRMYRRWAERRGFGFETLELSPAEEAGISSVTFTVKGRHAYGLLSAEKGVHRLVRISPFDSQARRQTSFASLEAVPAIERAEEPEINTEDLRIDTYRSQGAGGQHVNVTDSAVRLTHLPTGIVVSCQNERSQHQNKAKAMQILAARLADRARDDRRREMDAILGEKRDVAWGNQIRSYVLAPYQLVKDLRTEHETGNVPAVLDGELDPFMEAFLQWRRGGGTG